VHGDRALKSRVHKQQQCSSGVRSGALVCLCVFAAGCNTCPQLPPALQSCSTGVRQTLWTQPIPNGLWNCLRNKSCPMIVELRPNG